MNTIAHAIFGDELWTVEQRNLDRIRWFVDLVPDVVVGPCNNIHQCVLICCIADIK